MDEKINLADVVNELQRAARLYKSFEKGIEIAEIIRSADFDVRKAEKRVADAQKDADVKIAGIDKSVESANSELKRVLENLEQNKKLAKKIVDDAVNKADDIEARAKIAADDHRKSVERDLVSAKENLAAIKDQAAAAEIERAGAEKRAVEAKAELDSLVKAKEEMLKKFGG